MDGRNPATAILLFAHGSSVEEANQSVHELARRVEEQGSYGYVRATFLDVAQPDLSTAIAQAVGAGLGRVIVIPYFLTMGIHLRRDLPSLIASQRRKHPQAKIEVGESLEGHPLMASIILERVQQALQASGGNQ